MAPIKFGAVLRAEKPVRLAPPMIALFFSPENARIRCKFSARPTRNAPELRLASLQKHYDAARFLRRVAGACDVENARIQRSDMRKTLPKFASMTHKFAAKFSPFRRAARV